MRDTEIKEHDTHIHGVSEVGREDHNPANAVDSDMTTLGLGRELQQRFRLPKKESRVVHHSRGKHYVLYKPIKVCCMRHRSYLEKKKMIKCQIEIKPK